MDDQNFKDLALKAWELYDAIQNMQKLMLRLFIDEFITIDKQKQKQAIEQAYAIDDLPF